MLRIKVCCTQSIEEAWLAIGHGVHAIGLVSTMPTSNGVIPDDLIREIAAAVPPGVSSFLLTSRTDPDGIVDHQRSTGVNTLQLVDRIAPATLQKLRAALPGISLVQVVHVNGPEAVSEAESYAGLVDALLLDSGTPDARARSLGGTGRTHNWELSRLIVEASECPVFLAGGLSPKNVREAIDIVRPFGVDVCSGLRPYGRLDPALLGDFVSEVQAASAA